ncbi:hypothetical protein EJP82_19140 [Paenibacillus anaericanus]|uniref:DUF5668 domain-containing protein n=1 Tax=Paenibacillus anaericanus TaxID=170367 RepID=A0A433Y5G6_9BACL|nr:hypothetical protein [Paenibacillus anaericanus]RUT43816.1 hypothetical protein EJP82_19140 [Paenibacillus anaericanus]
MNKKSWIGPLVILLGVYLLFFRKEALTAGTLFGNFWPTIFVIPLGLFFHWMYFSMTGRRGSGLLIPGGILFTVGLVCQIATLFDSWEYLWPGFIAAPAVGLFEFYWFTDRNKWLLIPINILGGLSVLFFAVFSFGALYNRFIFGQPVLAIALIVIGVGVMIAPRKRS